MTKTLLVLAASTYQLDVIKAARRLGLRIVTTDNRPDNPGHRMADIAYCADTTDTAAVLDIAIKENISGVIAAATDVAVPTAAFISQELGLPGINDHAARTLTDKRAFREFQRQAGLPSPEVLDLTKIQDDSNNGTRGRWIIKPTRASGSKGIRILEHADERSDWMADAAAQSSNGAVLVEQFLEGTQHTLEGVFEAGKLGFFVVTDRMTASPPHVATRGHCVPSTLSSKCIDEISTQIASIFQQLDVQDCMLDCDFVSTDSGPVILEISPRLGGNSLNRLVACHRGVDLVKTAIHHATGGAWEMGPPEQTDTAAAILILGVDHDGKLHFSEKEAELLRATSWVKELVMDYGHGEGVRRFKDGRDRVGEILIEATNRNQLEQRMDEAMTRLDLRVT